MNCKIEAGEQVLGFGTPNEKIYQGFYVTIPNKMGSTISFVKHLSDAFDLIGKFDNQYDKFVEDVKRHDKMMSGNSWMHQDSFDNAIGFDRDGFDGI